MKKKIFIAVSFIVLVMAIMTACQVVLVPGDPTILYDPSAEGMEIIKDLNSYDVMQQAFTYYKNNANYKMTVDFIFNASPNFAYQVTSQTIIRNGNDYFEEYIIMGTGGAKDKNKGSMFKSVGGTVKAKYITESKMTLDKDNNKVTADFSKTSWGSFNADKEDEGINTPEDRINLSKNKLHQYFIGESYFVNDMDKQVYKQGDKYYCSLIINTKEMTNTTYQSAVVRAIEKSTNGKFVQFNENTRMVAELEKVGDTFRMTQFILMEDYSGKVSIVTLKVSQQYWHKFSYDEASLVIPQ